MIHSIHFKNFRLLRDTTLPLGRFTLLVGANNSGKSTALLGVSLLGRDHSDKPCRLLTLGANSTAKPTLTLQLEPAADEKNAKEKASQTVVFWEKRGTQVVRRVQKKGAWPEVICRSSYTRVFSLDPRQIARPSPLQPGQILAEDGSQLAGFLDRLRDEHPEHFDACNAEFTRWFPDFDRILFDRQSAGVKGLSFRLRGNRGVIAAEEASQGTLVGLALLALAHGPEPPRLLGLEEPDRTIHPRLLREVRDAIYRLAYPEQFGVNRDPVQVIATTHNPYFLDLFREHPEEVVVAERVGPEARFSPLSRRDDINEILGDASLGEVWYSGVLGGVPVESES